MYTPALEKLCILRMLQQVSQVYTSMKMPHLIAMIPFGSFDETEKLIVDAVKFNYLQVSTTRKQTALVL
jgi:translation initiation factor 3 subunit A